VMKKCFQMVADFLLWIARKTNLTYNEVNIIVYYGLIPLSWCVMLDYIIHKPVFTIAFIALWIVILLKVKSFSAWCDKGFKLSQRFICFFGEYIKYSVIICVIVPIIIYICLIALILTHSQPT
jgi:small-conductance mechanosensitive channel